MRKWYIPDAYFPSTCNGAYVSHEAVCCLNVTSEDATVNMTLYFEDREKMGGFTIAIPAERTIHCRLDKIVNWDGQPIPKDTPYAIVMESETDLKVQYTRVDTTQSELAIATTIV